MSMHRLQKGWGYKAAASPCLRVIHMVLIKFTIETIETISGLSQLAPAADCLEKNKCS